MRNIFIIFLVSILYIGAVFLAVQGKTFRADSDYDSNLPIVAYVVDTIRNEHRFPLWNPYVGATGISVLGDPLSGVAYLPYLVPMLLFGVPEGLWLVLGLHAFLAGVYMWMFLRSLKVNEEFSLWGGLLYMSAGAFASRVAAGHIEKVLSYTWYPLFLLFLFQKKTALMGVVMGVVFLTGDVYGLLFMVIFVGMIRVIGEIREIRSAVIAFTLVAAVKLVPFVREVLPVMERFSAFDAQRGSIPIWLSWLPFVMPAGVSFYDRPILQHAFGFWYNWYEYYAFVGLPVVFLFLLPRVVRRRDVQLLLILLAVGIAYIARGQVLSPFFGLSPLFSAFRTPPRMYTALTSIVVALIVLCAERVIRPPLGFLQGVALCILLLTTFLVSGYQMTNAFRPAKPCCTQLHRMREKIPIIDYYYGWTTREP